MNLLATVAELQRLSAERAPVEVVQSHTKEPKNIEKIIHTKFEIERRLKNGVFTHPHMPEFIATGLEWMDKLIKNRHEHNSKLIRTIVSRLVKCRGRINKILPGLNDANRVKAAKRGANNFRSIRIEAQCRVEKIIMLFIQFMDFSTLKIGRHRGPGKEFMSMWSYEQIAKWIGEKPIEKIKNGSKVQGYETLNVKRAMAKLRLGRYIRVERRYKEYVDKATGEVKYGGKTALKSFLPRFFTDLGISWQFLAKVRASKAAKHERVAKQSQYQLEKEAYKHLTAESQRMKSTLKEVKAKVCLPEEMLC